MSVWTASAVDALRAVLSKDARIDTRDSPSFAESSARWSDLGTPKPGLIVHPSSEEDVQAIVKHCTANKIPFVAQSGAHAWATTFRIDESGIVVNMRTAFAKVEVDSDALVATVGGGATVQEFMRAGKEKKCHAMTGACNTTGAMAGLLGGGAGPFMGMMGCGSDTMLSARVVLADGSLVTASQSENADLFWALRGAGHNFGIVTSAKVRVIPEINGGMHWMCLVAFPNAMLERIVETLEKTEVQPDMAAWLLFTRASPDMSHVVAVSMWHAGSQESATARFKGILELGGHHVVEGMVPYDHLNDGFDYVCYTGGFKRLYTVMMDHLSPSRMRTVWDDFVAFSATDDTKFTLIFVEYYNKDAARAAEDGVDAVGPGLRRHRLLGFAGAIYSDAARHAEAEAFGKKARSALGEGATNEDGKPNVYANLACGDEDAKQLYGAKGLERLRLLKARYDPQGIFSHFVPVPTA